MYRQCWDELWLYLDKEIFYEVLQGANAERVFFNIKKKMKELEHDIVGKELGKIEKWYNDKKEKNE